MSNFAAYGVFADNGLRSNGAGVGVPGAAAAAEQGVCHLAALSGSCVGSHAACHLFCAGTSPSSVMCCLCSDWPHRHRHMFFKGFHISHVSLYLPGQTDHAVVIKQAALDLPPVPGDLQRLYSQSHLALDAERMAAQR